MSRLPKSTKVNMRTMKEPHVSDVIKPKANTME